MLNQGINVPDKTIAFFSGTEYANMLKDVPQQYPTMDKVIPNIITKPEKTREWFGPAYYNCAPLLIGNQYGFVLSYPYDFSLYWKGGQEASDLRVIVPPHMDEHIYPRVHSNFGNGVVTYSLGTMFRTPPGVNLMTINPPNHFIDGLAVMTGVVETDNIRTTFTLNSKVTSANKFIDVPAGTPIAGIIPIPRFFADEFVLKNGEDIFEEDVALEEFQALSDQQVLRRSNLGASTRDRNYWHGKDVYGNSFIDHQTP
jgi:hypothetical protein